MEAYPVLVGMKDQDPQNLDSVKSAYQVDLVHPSPSPQLTTSSVGSMDRVTVPVQHDGAHSEAAIPVKVPFAQATRVVQKGTNASRNSSVQLAKVVKTSCHPS